MLYFRSPDLSPANASPDDLHDLFEAPHRTEFAASGLAHGAVVETAAGPVLARDLRPGDRLITRDRGMQALRWVGSSTVVYGTEPDSDEHSLVTAPADGPVRVRAGALGTNSEAGNLLLAPGQRLLSSDPLNGLYFGAEEVLVQAADLTHVDGVDRVARHVGRWTHLLFDHHELILVNGVWTESFVPDMWSIHVAFPEQWQEMIEALPRLSFAAGAAAYVENRVTLDGREAGLINAA